MELEREKGITIKLQPIRMIYQPNPKSQIPNSKQIQNINDKNSKSLGFRDSNLEFANSKYILNLLDTPGHVDFSYEVSRSLAAVEGVILLIDAKKGIQAQTIAHLEEAKKQNLVIIPVINKIDLPEIEIGRIVNEVKTFLDCKEEEILKISAKTGENVEEVLKNVVKLIPAPKGDGDGSPRALIFDSYFDKYKGVVAFVRLIDGEIKKGQEIYLIQGENKGEAIELGYLKEKEIQSASLKEGEIGYIVTNLRSLEKARVGDTITLLKNKDIVKALPGYAEPRHFVYAEFFVEDGDNFVRLKVALEKLALNDASLYFVPAKSYSVMGKGFHCGFLGLLHLEITKERLKREFEIEPIITSPTVNLEIEKSGKFVDLVDPFQYDNQGRIKEPFVLLEIVTPATFMGRIMEALSHRRSKTVDTQFLSPELVLLKYEIPLSEVIIDFYDGLKSMSQGFASMSYNFLAYRESKLARLDIKIAGELVEPFSRIIPYDVKESEAKYMAKRLKKLLPRQNFKVAIQVLYGGRILAREDVPAFRKDVIAKLYGGDRTRKDKLLKKQAKGKKKMQKLGKVDIPPDIFLDMIKK